MAKYTEEFIQKLRQTADQYNALAEKYLDEIAEEERVEYE